MTRLLHPVERLKVELDGDGLLLAFFWRGHRHAVLLIANQWRADAEWWRTRQWREHFKLITDTGFLLVVYHDLGTDAWYVQRMYD